VFATGIPQRKDLAPGSLTGEIRNYRWQVNVGPVGGGWVVDSADAAWIPELVKIRVRSPSGAAIDLETVRLMRGQKR
jgi:general secretion pathway protein I